MKRAWAFSCILVLSAILSGCNKDGSKNAAPESGASASQAASQPEQAASGAPAASGAQAGSAPAVVTKAQLPGEAAETLRLIKAGGPFPFSEDGVVFRNSAGLLPQHPRGYYRAYTVRTPGAADRGLRRIVCGGSRKKISDCYYTEDYYVSFKRITE
ncbi:guanine-specific ribonuclease N1 and T1 [Caballeronia terrestris]|uniref:Guanine-specific ribonuclease N1 and T1 n=1 Tax=Caballeronia terrestris TaxID=1226301 RepID=A0A158KPZ7_9BURK|nr:ribonuclease [Caballeronia terrestris]SAL83154.1 guanine-specific ribonuclease N1 and T1 [Caballeronia terrestris]